MTKMGSCFEKCEKKLRHIFAKVGARIARKL